MAPFYIFYTIIINILAIFAETTLSSNTSNSTFTRDAPVPLTFGYYKDACPATEPIVYAHVAKAVSRDPRIAASLLRLHFHDCFVNGCDASVLLDDRPDFEGEKTAGANINTLRGFEVIDDIKSDLESICPLTVSCADILALAARDSVLTAGGPGWDVEMGRKDSLSASKSAANNNIAGPNSNLATLVSKFQAVGLSSRDVVILSGAHTMGKAHCSSFSSRLTNINSPDINLEFVQSLQQLCGSSAANTTTLANLDRGTPTTFDNQYYINLLSGEGLLPSDQALISGDNEARQLVQSFVDEPRMFFQEFSRSMIKMASLSPSTGAKGEIRKNCRVVNQFNQ